MSTWKAVVTEKGEALLAKMTQGSTMEITHAEVGAGTVDISLLKQQTSVSTMKQTAQISPVGYPEEGMCALPVTITNEGIEAAYPAWQIGIFANDPDEGKILFFLAQAEDTATNIPSATLMPSYKTQIIFHVEYGAADSVTVDVNPANSVSQAGMENYVAEQLAMLTPDSEKHVAYAQRAGEADQVPYALTVRVNGGRTEGTDQWTFDGSTSRTINLTPDKIGAAEEEHTHDDRYYTETEMDEKLAAKATTISGAASTIASSNLTASRALVSNSSGKVGVSAVTATELGYLDGVTSKIQTQLNAKLPLSGGTVSGTLVLGGILVLTEGVHYGATLPDPGTKGRIFFRKV